LDEPLSNLDARLREEVRGKIRELAKQIGATVLYVTHDQVEAMANADKIALMQSGELLQVGPPMELYHRPCRAEVAEFFGSVNWLKGKILEPSLAETPIGHIRINKPLNLGEEVLVGFRPESLTIMESHGSANSNSFQGTLRSSTFLGDQVVYCVEVENQLLMGKGRAGLANSAGPIYLHVDPVDVMVFPAGQKTGVAAIEQSDYRQTV
jgi:ABC-type sugar transport system ATPase subunit